MISTCLLEISKNVHVFRLSSLIQNCARCISKKVLTVTDASSKKKGSSKSHTHSYLSCCVCTERGSSVLRILKPWNLSGSRVECLPWSPALKKHSSIVFVRFFRSGTRPTVAPLYATKHKCSKKIPESETVNLKYKNVKERGLSSGKLGSEMRKIAFRIKQEQWSKKINEPPKVYSESKKTSRKTAGSILPSPQLIGKALNQADYKIVVESQSLRELKERIEKKKPKELPLGVKQNALVSYSLQPSEVPVIRSLSDSKAKQNSTDSYLENKELPLPSPYFFIQETLNNKELEKGASSNSSLVKENSRSELKKETKIKALVADEPDTPHIPSPRLLTSSNENKSFNVNVVTNQIDSALKFSFPKKNVQDILGLIPTKEETQSQDSCDLKTSNYPSPSLKYNKFSFPRDEVCSCSTHKWPDKIFSTSALNPPPSMKLTNYNSELSSGFDDYLMKSDKDIRRTSKSKAILKGKKSHREDTNQQGFSLNRPSLTKDTNIELQVAKQPKRLSGDLSKSNLLPPINEKKIYPIKSGGISKEQKGDIVVVSKPNNVFNKVQIDNQSTNSAQKITIQDHTPFLEKPLNNFTPVLKKDMHSKSSNTGFRQQKDGKEESERPNYSNNKAITRVDDQHIETLGNQEASFVEASSPQKRVLHLFSKRVIEVTSPEDDFDNINNRTISPISEKDEIHKINFQNICQPAKIQLGNKDSTLEDIGSTLKLNTTSSRRLQIGKQKEVTSGNSPTDSAVNDNGDVHIPLKTEENLKNKHSSTSTQMESTCRKIRCQHPSHSSSFDANEMSRKLDQQDVLFKLKICQNAKNENMKRLARILSAKKRSGRNPRQCVHGQSAPYYPTQSSPQSEHSVSDGIAHESGFDYQPKNINNLKINEKHEGFLESKDALHPNVIDQENSEVFSSHQSIQMSHDGKYMKGEYDYGFEPQVQKGKSKIVKHAVRDTESTNKEKGQQHLDNKDADKYSYSQSHAPTRPFPSLNVSDDKSFKHLEYDMDSLPSSNIIKKKKENFEPEERVQIPFDMRKSLKEQVKRYRDVTIESEVKHRLNNEAFEFNLAEESKRSFEVLKNLVKEEMRVKESSSIKSFNVSQINNSENLISEVPTCTRRKDQSKESVNKNMTSGINFNSKDLHKSSGISPRNQSNLKSSYYHLGKAKSFMKTFFDNIGMDHGNHNGSSGSFSSETTVNPEHNGSQILSKPQYSHSINGVDSAKSHNVESRSQDTNLNLNEESIKITNIKPKLSNTGKRRDFSATNKTVPKLKQKSWYDDFKNSNDTTIEPTFRSSNSPYSVPYSPVANSEVHTPHSVADNFRKTGVVDPPPPEFIYRYPHSTDHYSQSVHSSSPSSLPYHRKEPQDSSTGMPLVEDANRTYNEYYSKPSSTGPIDSIPPNLLNDSVSYAFEDPKLSNTQNNSKFNHLNLVNTTLNNKSDYVTSSRRNSHSIVSPSPDLSSLFEITPSTHDDKNYWYEVKTPLYSKNEDLSLKNSLDLQLPENNMNFNRSRTYSSNRLETNGNIVNTVASTNDNLNVDANGYYFYKSGAFNSATNSGRSLDNESYVNAVKTNVSRQYPHEFDVSHGTINTQTDGNYFLDHGSQNVDATTNVSKQYQNGFEKYHRTFNADSEKGYSYDHRSNAALANEKPNRQNPYEVEVPYYSTNGDSNLYYQNKNPSDGVRSSSYDTKVLESTNHDLTGREETEKEKQTSGKLSSSIKEHDKKKSDSLRTSSFQTRVVEATKKENHDVATGFYKITAKKKRYLQPQKTLNSFKNKNSVTSQKLSDNFSINPTYSKSVADSFQKTGVVEPPPPEFVYRYSPESLNNDTNYSILDLPKNLSGYFQKLVNWKNVKDSNKNDGGDSRVAVSAAQSSNSKDDLTIFPEVPPTNETPFEKLTKPLTPIIEKINRNVDSYYVKSMFVDNPMKSISKVAFARRVNANASPEDSGCSACNKISQLSTSIQNGVPFLKGKKLNHNLKKGSISSNEHEHPAKIIKKVLVKKVVPNKSNHGSLNRFISKNFEPSEVELNMIKKEPFIPIKPKSLFVSTKQIELRRHKVVGKNVKKVIQRSPLKSISKSNTLPDKSLNKVIKMDVNVPKPQTAITSQKGVTMMPSLTKQTKEEMGSKPSMTSVKEVAGLMVGASKKTEANDSTVKVRNSSNAAGPISDVENNDNSIISKTTESKVLNAVKNSVQSMSKSISDALSSNTKVVASKMSRGNVSEPEVSHNNETYSQVKTLGADKCAVEPPEKTKHCSKSWLNMLKKYSDRKKKTGNPYKAFSDLYSN